jgi:hypothetical protein
MARAMPMHESADCVAQQRETVFVTQIFSPNVI